jgi:hypothetical protein
MTILSKPRKKASGKTKVSKASRVQTKPAPSAVAQVAQQQNAIHRASNRLAQLQVENPALRSFIGTAASGLGGVVGGLFGNPIAGATAGKALANYFGHGDYQIISNSLMDGTASSRGTSMTPVFSKDGRRGVRVTERECLGDILSGPATTAGSTDFTLQNFPVNPGMAVTFPWLSTIANSFDQWEPNGIVFEFRSTSSEYNGSSQALGAVIMATDYDVLDPPPTTKVAMESYDYANSSRPCDTQVHGLECEPSERPDRVLFTRSGPVVGTDNPRFYDLANFMIATKGCSVANVTLGELWVSYDITFYKKAISNYTPSSVAGGVFFSANTDLATNSPWGFVRNSFGSLGMLFSNKTMYFPATTNSGNYLLILNGNVATALTYGSLSGVNCTITQNVGDPFFPGVVGPPWPSKIDSGSGTANATKSWIVTVTGANASITQEGLSRTGAVTAAQVMVIQLPSTNLLPLP